MTYSGAVLDAYGRLADEYAGLFGAIEAAHPEDRELVLRWADGLRGTVLDVGCGPGHWTALLTAAGHDVEGVDPVPRFVELACQAFPESRFRVGSIARLGVRDGSLGGVLAWYSLIHHEPSQLPAALAALHRALRPGGSLLVGCFTGDAPAPLPHAVAPAYTWPLTALADHLVAVGFRVTQTHRRATGDGRDHGAVVATVPPGP